jgi:pyruvate dehydrogenase E2 component (dihydrolipoamide acetyltransferase)
MSEGAVGRWLKKPGDPVADGDIIAEIETDKATMELQAFESGTLQQILVPEGQTVPIGQTIAIIGDGPAAEHAAASASQEPQQAASAPPSGAQQAPAEEGGAEAIARNTAEAKAEVQQAPASPQPQAAPPAAQSNGQAGDGRIKASPLARRMADERGIDLRQVQGTGPGGRIIKENIESFQPAAAQAATPAAAPAAPAPVPGAPQPAAQRQMRPPSRWAACGARSPVR